MVSLHQFAFGQVAAPEIDYSAELPRTPAVEPANALVTFKVQPGYRLELVASEPLVSSPVAVCWDEAGRLFVVEMRGYSEDRAGNMGRIRCLTDADDDGRYDHASVFVDGFAWPTALACWDGGLFVADAPDIFYCKDTDGDGSADVKRVVFTGFGTGNVQGLLNSLEWHFDQRIYGAASSNQGSITNPSNATLAAVDLHGRDFSFNPQTLDLRAECGGAQHGASFDDWGNRFVCSNSDHLQQVMLEDRYLSRNPRLVVPATRISIAADGPQATVFRASPVEPWRIVRTRLRVAGSVPGPIEGGGRPAGYFTGATGSTVVRGDAFPEEWHHVVVVGDAGGNIVHRKKLHRNGLEFVGERMDVESEFVASTDIWFRPVQFANGPDGGLYIIDMYREVIEHPDSLPPVIKKHLDLTSGRDRGRIYRVVPDTFQRRGTPHLENVSSHELVPYLDHANAWHRATASRLLSERRDSTCIEPLIAMAEADSTSPQGKIGAMYALASLTPLPEDLLLKLLAADRPEVRRHAIRLAESQLVSSPAIVAKLLNSVDDPALEVRFQLAFSLGEIPDTCGVGRPAHNTTGAEGAAQNTRAAEASAQSISSVEGSTHNTSKPANNLSAQRTAALARLLARDPSDRWMRVAGISSLREDAGQLLLHLLRDPEASRSPESIPLYEQLAAQLNEHTTPDEWNELIDILHKVPAAEAPFLARLVLALPNRTTEVATAAEDKAPGTASNGMTEIHKRVLAWARLTSADGDSAIYTRVAAIGALRLAPYCEIRDLAAELLVPAEPQEIQTAILDVLSHFSETEIALSLLQAWQAWTPETLRTALSLNTRRSERTDILQAGLEKGEIPHNQIEHVTADFLRRHPVASLATRFQQLQQNPNSSRSDVLAAYRQAVEISGDAIRGEATFQRICSSCHRIGEAGQALGPSLPAMVNRGKEAILLAVLDPNREVNPQYENFVITTHDGRVLSGMITAETGNGLSLQRTEGSPETISRADIEELRGTGQSFMPEGIEQQIDPLAMADLLAFLQAQQ